MKRLAIHAGVLSIALATTWVAWSELCAWVVTFYQIVVFLAGALSGAGLLLFIQFKVLFGGRKTRPVSTDSRNFEGLEANLDPLDVSLNATNDATATPAEAEVKTAQQGYIFLVPCSLVRNVSSAPPPAAQRFAKLRGNQLLLTGSEQATNAVTVDLTNCTVEIVPDPGHKHVNSLRRKLPLLLVESSGRHLARGESKLYIYLKSGSAKEAWYQSLMSALNAEGEAARAVHDAKKFPAYGREAIALAMVYNTQGEGAHMLNVMLARIWYDLHRNPSVAAKLRTHFQRKVDRFNVPAFIRGMHLDRFRIGNIPVTVTSVRAVPPEELTSVDAGHPGGAMENLACFDLSICYKGKFSFALSTNIDLKQAASGFTGGANPEAEAPMTKESESEQPKASTWAGRANATKERIKMLAGKAAEKVAERLSDIPLTLDVHVTSLQGNLRVWISPPPSDRMWVGFMEEPNMEMVANPLVGARGIKHTKVASKVSQWVVGKLRGMISNLYVLPACTDMRVPGLLGCPGLQDRVAVPRALPESTTPQSESEPSSPTCVDNQAPSPFSTPMATPMDNPIPSPNGGLTPSGKPGGNKFIAAFKAAYRSGSNPDKSGGAEKPSASSRETSGAAKAEGSASSALAAATADGMEAVRSGEDAAVAEELCCSHSEAAVGSLGEGGELAEQKLLDQRLEDAAPNLLGGSLAASEEAQGELASQPSTPPRSFAAAEDSTEDQGDPAEQLQPGLPMLNMGEANNDDFVARTPVKGGDPSEDRPLSATSSVSAPDSPDAFVTPMKGNNAWMVDNELFDAPASAVASPEKGASQSPAVPSVVVRRTPVGGKPLGVNVLELEIPPVPVALDPAACAGDDVEPVSPERSTGAPDSPDGSSALPREEGQQFGGKLRAQLTRSAMTSMAAQAKQRLQEKSRTAVPFLEAQRQRARQILATRKNPPSSANGTPGEGGP
ncbi:hypothetical protein CYMTET_7675 [Cymbomonas tetramitiformis]|uniref:SMP-LTD domain-containing protein n=1 Tax=Cymbomonas tetramitiformis TaxID=36881 RepID=A0AAE0GV81_9CHLO|nr:hypothetical protein CYMTET_7675 [Cymbomonas tetramitiformis]